MDYFTCPFGKEPIKKFRKWVLICDGTNPLFVTFKVDRQIFFCQFRQVVLPVISKITESRTESWNWPMKTESIVTHNRSWNWQLVHWNSGEKEGCFFMENIPGGSSMCGTFHASQTLLPPSQTMQACQNGHPRRQKSLQKKYESHCLAQNTNPSNSQIASTCQMICCFANFGNLMSLETRRYMQRPLAVQRPSENQGKHCAAYSARSDGTIGLKSNKIRIPIN